jgi:hypothetical protein
MKILVPIIFTIVAMVLMAAALHFAKYKKRKQSGCCGAHEVCMHNRGNEQQQEHEHHSGCSHKDHKTKKT